MVHVKFTFLPSLTLAALRVFQARAAALSIGIHPRVVANAVALLERDGDDDAFVVVL